MTHQAPIIAAPSEGALETPLPETGFPDPPHDRWCQARMADFLSALAATHSVAEAARSVGMSRQSAYRLRAP